MISICKRLKTTILAIFLVTGILLFSFVDPCEDNAPTPAAYTLGFYNVENLFDTEDDPQAHDNEYLPGNEKEWDGRRYQKKLDMIARVILAMNEWEGPDVLGLCEVENKTVLKDLIQETNLKTFGYSIVHRDSKDKRGIDVALLYKHRYFKVNEVNMLPVPLEKEKHTRDIMAVRGRFKGDTSEVFLFVNHWPSRWGGVAQSAPDRKSAASTLRSAIDSLQKHYHRPQIMILGDFNDGLDDVSLMSSLKAGKCTQECAPNTLCNLAYCYMEKGETGTLKYQHQWNYFDQIIVSACLLDSARKLSVPPSGATIFNPDWLMTDDDKFGGKKPFRTYSGPYYTGGYSDHFPVMTTVDLRNK